MAWSSKIFFGILLLVVSYASVQSDSGENKTMCDPDQMACADGNGCTGLDYRCDGDNDCSDGSDESAEICKENCAGIADRLPCDDGTCIRRTCGDNCDGIEERFQCSNKKCTNAYRVCNGRDDCGDNSDESDEMCANCNGDTAKIKCAKSNKCINESDMCDGVKDCAIRDDNFDIIVEDDTDENCVKEESG